mgnify:CR=1 FL=1
MDEAEGYDPVQLERLSQDGRLAEELLRNQSFQYFASSVLNDLQLALFATGHNDKERREQLYQQHTGMRLLTDTLVAVAQKGRQAREFLAEEAADPEPDTSFDEDFDE